MLKLTVEIVPFGDEEKTRVLDTVQIVNMADHPEAPEVGNYRVTSTRNPEKVYVFNHRRDEGYWPLVMKIAGLMRSQETLKLEKALEELYSDELDDV